MAYSPPIINNTGLHIPSYQDILDDLIQQAKSIYGQDIYLGPDSQDYQFISIFALKTYDCMQALQLAYNSRGPGTAIGSALDGLVKLNGIARSRATYSTCSVTLTGTAGTPITGGVVQDVSGYLWNIPAITIEAGGTVSATATCQVPGAIAANPGDINKIVTPTYGWTAVNNSVSAIIGTAAETDSQLRSRQAISTAQPSRTILDGIRGAIASVVGVTRFIVHENDTDEIDSEGLPAHSITAIVEGGTDADIAQAIFDKKGPGCYTNGTTSVTLVDSYNNSTTIRFYRPTYIDIDAAINVKQLPGYTTQSTADIKAAVANYLNSLIIGGDLPISSLWGAALSTQNLSAPTYSITSLTAAKHDQDQGTSDIEIAFNEITRGNIDYITVNVT